MDTGCSATLQRIGVVGRWWSREVVVDLIGHTTTRTGLAIQSALDENSYPTGREVTVQQLESLAITHEKFHGESNCTIQPRT